MKIKVIVTLEAEFDIDPSSYGDPPYTFEQIKQHEEEHLDASYIINHPKTKQTILIEKV